MTEYSIINNCHKGKVQTTRATPTRPQWGQDDVNNSQTASE